MAASLAVLAPLLGPLSCQATLIVPLVLVLMPRLAGPGHLARPDPPLVAPRDHRHLRPLPRHLGLDLLARPEVLEIKCGTIVRHTQTLREPIRLYLI